jgi:hypothetical protein
MRIDRRLYVWLRGGDDEQLFDGVRIPLYNKALIIGFAYEGRMGYTMARGLERRPC